ncbi:metal-dependent hydrolase family protein [Levilactobacillus mulengensis]|uniref:metal-dependent hydrolase family protein n=1 Tax=Levilactobacillus mulengensis TaxID=2486025 RepID=UPI000F7880C3|nr:amidohydrolase family protein [Levilactobacillus mulengensis]
MTKKTFYNFTLFDGAGDQNTPDAWFTVDTDTGKITACGTGHPDTADEQVDLHGQYVMPGFINVHTHITSNPDSFSGSFGASESESAVFGYENLQKLLKSGVTYIRQCGATYDVDIKLKRLQRDGILPHTPHIMASGRAFSMTGGHGDGRNSAYLVDSPDEMRKGVRQAFKAGAECIKVMATGGVMTPNDFMEDPQLSVPEMHVAVEEAHHKRRIVAAHAEGNPGIQNALDAGVDAIDDTYHNLKRAFEIGVKFTCGTDAGTPFNGFDRTPDEFGLLTKVGMTPAQAYQCSSINSATLLGVADDYGTLEVGKHADFQVLRADPLADTAAVKQADKGVYVGGIQQF